MVLTHTPSSPCLGVKNSFLCGPRYHLADVFDDVGGMLKVDLFIHNIYKVGLNKEKRREKTELWDGSTFPRTQP